MIKQQFVWAHVALSAETGVWRASLPQLDYWAQGATALGAVLAAAEVVQDIVADEPARIIAGIMTFAEPEAQAIADIVVNGRRFELGDTVGVDDVLAVCLDVFQTKVESQSGIAVDVVPTRFHRRRPLPRPA